MDNVLTYMTFIPVAGAVVVLALPNNAKLIRWVSAAATVPPLMMAIWLFKNFDRAKPGFQFIEDYYWIPSFNISYTMGIDGLSISMVLLTALLSFLCIFASFGIEKAVKGYFALFLLLEAGMMGVFEAMDFFLFYVFWEVMLLPMYFLIGIWGGPRREYAAIKFFLYTLAGSVLMLVVMIAMYFSATDPATGKHTFDLQILANQGPAAYRGGWWRAAFLGLYIGFAIKVPVFPFHTWLPDAHVEAPTPISVILAGVLLKMGTYGLMRISYPILPDAALWFAPFMMAFGAWNIIYGSLCAMAQIRGVPRVNSQTGERFVERDLKKMIAYSSVAHMGFCLLGPAAR